MSCDMEDGEPRFTREAEKKQRAGEYGPNPFSHAVRPASMNGCLGHCRACEWERMQHLTMRERLGYPPTAIRLTDYDYNLLNGMHISWDMDTRCQKS